MVGVGFLYLIQYFFDTQIDFRLSARHWGHSDQYGKIGTSGAVNK